MKKKRRMLSVFISILVLSALFFLSACGKKEEEPAEDIVVDQIYSGAFSQENANEIFVDCRLKGMPHAGGLDIRAGILLDADTMERIVYKDFAGDHVMLYCLQTAKGQSRILFYVL